MLSARRTWERAVFLCGSAALMAPAGALLITYPTSDTLVAGNSNWHINWTSNASDPRLLDLYLTVANGKGLSPVTLGTAVPCRYELYAVSGSDLSLRADIEDYFVEINANEAAGEEFVARSQEFRIDGSKSAATMTTKTAFLWWLSVLVAACAS
jgi:hypothetical protein